MVRKSKALVDSLREYFREQLKYAYTALDHVGFAYSSDNGKIGLNKNWIWKASGILTSKEFVLLMLVVTSLKPSHNPIDSGVAWLHEKDYPDFDRRFFNASIKKFVELEYIFYTGERKWYVINPKYVNNYYKVKKEKNGNG